ncbi:MAG TPA: hypothetical protein VM141_12285 [Planctomycetota bacterium]|nr:hypothetical protein [Planctomycetota bacterium]
MIKHVSNRGNALAELVILLPIYVLVIFGLIYLSDLTGIRTLLHPAVEQTAARPGTASAVAMERRIFSLYRGSLTLEEEAQQDFPTAGELRRMLEYLNDPPSVPWAQGSWQFVNGQLVPVVSTGSSSRPREIGDEQLDDDEAELLELTLTGYQFETGARAQFSYNPANTRVGPVDFGRQELEARHRVFVRGELERSVEGDGQGHPIEGLVQMMRNGQKLQDYPDFSRYRRELWTPDMVKGLVP